MTGVDKAEHFYIITDTRRNPPELIGPFVDRASALYFGDEHIGFDDFWVYDIRTATSPNDFKDEA